MRIDGGGDDHQPEESFALSDTLPSRRARRRHRGSKLFAKTDGSSTGSSSTSTSRMERRRGQQTLRGNSRRARAETYLHETLAELGCVEEDDSTRRQALDWLERILARWSMTCDNTSTAASIAVTAASSDKDDLGSPMKKKARAPATTNSWQRPRPVLIAFGSYRLGVHRPSSDLDLLVLAPSHITRDDFFSSLVRLLKQQDAAVIQHVHPIPTAYTPVIKFTLHGLSVDLLFAGGNSFKIMQYQQKRPNPLLMAEATTGPLEHRDRTTTTDEYLIDDSDLLDQDEAGVRSLNGARVSQMILEAVPHLECYRTVLTAVKQWAIAKGIYSNVLGFLGGINYAIMVAHVCIHNHPAISHDPVALLERFFTTFATWKWPKPVMIAPLQSERPSSCILPMPSWNPATNRRDGLHCMPIITPAYPSMNSSYNVDIPQLRRMTHEMTMAANVMAARKWRHSCFYHLFCPSDFFSRHCHFLQVVVASQTHAEHVEWLRLVESRLRLLIGCLETPEIHAWPFAKVFHKPPRSEAATTTIGQGSSNSSDNGVRDADDYESSFYIALRFAPNTKCFDLRGLTSDFCHQVNSWEKRTSGMDLRLDHVLAPHLPAYVVPPLRKLQDDASTETAASSSWASSTDIEQDLDDDEDVDVEQGDGDGGEVVVEEKEEPTEEVTAKEQQEMSGSVEPQVVHTSAALE